MRWKTILSAMLSVAVAGTAHAELLLSYDFNGANPWPDASTDVLPSTPIPVEPSIEPKEVGTIDTAGSTKRTGGMLLSTDVGAVTGDWEATFTSGQLPVKNAEKNLGKLTLAFDLSVSTLRPVAVRFESFNASHVRTGALETVVIPAAADFYQRSAIDLSTMKPVGDGKFDPVAPFVQIVFKLSGPTWPAQMKHELRLDNVSYATPSFYVSPNGKDSNDGRTEKTALADPQKAVERAKPGDIIVLMDGEYHRAPSTSIHDGVIGFLHPGTPAAWIVVKNYPGQHPVLKSDAWNTIKIGRNSKEEAANQPALAYLEMRGLHIVGNSYTLKRDHPETIGKVEPISNTNGISVDGRMEPSTPHHLRIVDNTIERCCGGGATAGNADWVTIQNNTITDNCWFMIYAGSGVSLLGTSNFDAESNVYKSLVSNNRVFGNRCYMPWSAIQRMSDGNGIIVDTNHTPGEGSSYLGRTLIENNLVVASGGSGIHSFRSHQIDVINNTVYYNASTSALSWGQLFAQRTDDIRFINNIAVARPKQPLNTVSYEYSDKGNTHIIRSNNVYVSGGTPYVHGTNDLLTDPMFINANVDPAKADFRLKDGSPALKYGTHIPFGPLIDINGAWRPFTGPVDAGAFQK